MPEILVFYFFGLAAAVVVGIVFYFVIGGSIGEVVQSVMGRRTGALMGRSARVFLLVTVLIGGLSTQWHGCGYTDYQSVAASRARMLQKSTEQVSGAITYGKTYIFLAAGISAVVVALLSRGLRERAQEKNAVGAANTSAEKAAKA